MSTALLPADNRLSRLAGGMGLALQKPAFQWVLLTLAGIPFLSLYISASVVFCLTRQVPPPDFVVYVNAARAIAGGENPYALPVLPDTSTAVNGGYEYPPVLAWLLQPLVHDPLLAYRLFVVVGEVGVLGAILALSWGLQLRSWRARVLLALAVIGYEPLLLDFAFGQVMVLLFAMAALWYAATARERAWGHAVLGLAIAVKLLQAPAMLLAAARLRWRWLVVGMAGLIVPTAVAAPALLPTYFSHTFNGLATGTGDVRNIGLAGILTRLLHPGPLAPAHDIRYFDVTVLSYSWSLLLVAVSFWLFWLGRSQVGPGLRVDLALASLLSALIAPLLFATHLVIVLVGMIGLFHSAWTARRWRLAALVAACYVITGPAPWHSINYLAGHGFGYPWLEVVGAVDYVAILALWAVAVVERWRLLPKARPAYSVVAQLGQHP